MPEKLLATPRIGILDQVPLPRGGQRVTIAVMAPQARFALRLAAADATRLGRLAGCDVGMPINRFVRTGERTAARLGPDEWLLSMPEVEAVTFSPDAAAALASLHHALTDIGHRHVAIDLRGPSATDVLAAGCPLDLERMVAGDATRTIFGKIEVILFRIEGDAAPVWRIECWRSHARYLLAYLAEASREFNVG